MIDLSLDTHPPLFSRVPFFDMAKCDEKWPKFAEECDRLLQQHHPPDLDSTNALDEEARTITNAICSAISNTFNTKKPSKKHGISPRTAFLIKEKRRLRRKWQRSRCAETKRKLNRICREISASIVKDLQKAHERIKDCPSHKDAKIRWSNINCILNGGNRKPINGILNDQGTLERDEAEIADLTVTYLQRVQSRPPADPLFPTQDQDMEFFIEEHPEIFVNAHDPPPMENHPLLDEISRGELIIALKKAKNKDSLKSTQKSSSMLMTLPRWITILSLTRSPATSAGTPQGGILSPTIYLLWINPLAHGYRDSIHPYLYADDSTLTSLIRVKPRAMQIGKRNIQEAVNQLELTCKRKRMKINPQKSMCLLITKSRAVAPEFKIFGDNIPRVNQAKLLGIIFQRSGIFHQHAAHLKRKTDQIALQMYKFKAPDFNDEIRSRRFPPWLVEYIKVHRASQTRPLEESQYLVFRVSKDHKNLQGGLGNRMLGLFMTFFYAVATDRVFLIYWNKPYNITELFTPSTIDWNFRSAEVYSMSTKYSYIDQAFSKGNWDNSTSWPQFTAVAINTLNILFKLQFQPKPIQNFFKLENITMNMEHAFNALFKPTANLHASVRKLRQSVGLKPLEPFISMHLRVGKGASIHWNDPPRSRENESTILLHCGREVQTNLSQELSVDRSKLPLVFFSDSLGVKAKVVQENADVRTTEIARISHTERSRNLSLEDWRETWAEVLFLSEARCAITLGGAVAAELSSSSRSKQRLPQRMAFLLGAECCSPFKEETMETTR
ncbi:unnamed protein product [Cyprideis torosa]|uniref:Reverse transcriptase domain-containing protein n=1 Tax=Cyprideis torosa TaxID=163714 RepID=A0A7R8WKJ5_9CRUS|nr:unnamed protein product [Cyprideis torosa]CAG0897040.1 unnamed protein product [Cyprideis torosa]